MFSQKKIKLLKLMKLEYYLLFLDDIIEVEIVTNSML